MLTLENLFLSILMLFDFPKIRAILFSIWEIQYKNIKSRNV